MLEARRARFSPKGINIAAYHLRALWRDLRGSLYAVLLRCPPHFHLWRISADFVSTAQKVQHENPLKAFKVLSLHTFVLT